MRAQRGGRVLMHVHKEGRSECGYACTKRKKSVDARAQKESRVFMRVHKERDEY